MSPGLFIFNLHDTNWQRVFYFKLLTRNKHKNRLLDTSIFIIQLRLPDFIAHKKIEKERMFIYMCIYLKELLRFRHVTSA